MAGMRVSCALSIEARETDASPRRSMKSMVMAAAYSEHDDVGSMSSGHAADVRQSLSGDGIRNAALDKNLWWSCEKNQNM